MQLFNNGYFKNDYNFLDGGITEKERVIYEDISSKLFYGLYFSVFNPVYIVFRKESRK